MLMQSAMFLFFPSQKIKGKKEKQGNLFFLFHFTFYLRRRRSSWRGQRERAQVLKLALINYLRQCGESRLGKTENRIPFFFSFSFSLLEFCYSIYTRRPFHLNADEGSLSALHSYTASSSSSSYLDFAGFKFIRLDSLNSINQSFVSVWYGVG
jgi:hypothetical protein